MAGIQPSIPAPIPPPDRHRPPSRPPPRHLLLRHQQIQPPLGDINPNLIPIMHQRQRPAHRRLRRDMQNTGPIRSPAHPCIRQPQQITNTRRQQLLRNRQLPPLRHPRRPHRPDPPQHQNRIGVNRQLRRINTPFQIRHPVKNNRPPDMPMQTLRRRRSFNHTTIRRQAPHQHLQPPALLQRPRQRPNHPIIINRRRRRHIRRKTPARNRPRPRSKKTAAPVGTTPKTRRRDENPPSQTPLTA